MVAHLRRGGVVAYPTETVYGLGGACTEAGVRRVRMLKKRGAGKPLIALVESREAIAGLEWTESARVLADVFWPGALTLVLRDPHHLFPEGVRDEASGTVGVRVSPHPLAARLVRALGAPLTSTSLNPPGDAPAASGEEAARLVRALGGGDVWILDAGTLPPSGPSDGGRLHRPRTGRDSGGDGAARQTSLRHPGDPCTIVGTIRSVSSSSAPETRVAAPWPR